MKTKLTLSIDKKRVAQLRKASARRSKSISALIEEIAEQLDKDDSKKRSFKEEFADLIGLPLDPAWVEEDTWQASHLRKSAAGEGAMKELKKKRSTKG
jgi:hypothetical protein